MFAPQPNQDNPNWILDSIGFFNPVIGLLIYLAIRHDVPRKAGSVLRASVFGIIAVPASLLLTFAAMCLLKLFGLA